MPKEEEVGFLKQGVGRIMKPKVPCITFHFLEERTQRCFVLGITIHKQAMNKLLIDLSQTERSISGIIQQGTLIDIIVDM